MIESLTQFGTAGLMGALWLWERTHSRKRERQLSEAHRKLIDTDRQLCVLVRLVRQNTRALMGFENAQRRLCQLLEDISHEIQRQKS
jgi:phage-related minor tail protein